VRTTTRFLGTLLALWLGLAVSACGSAPTPTPKAADPEPSGSATKAPSLLDQPWLLRINTDGGADGELTTAVYLHFTPSTGAITIHQLPGLATLDTYSGSQALMVSADQKYALLDSAVSRVDKAHGRLSLYPTAPGKRVFLDLRALTGMKGLRPVGVAFDPTDGEVLRVVDDKLRVWKVDPVARTAARVGALRLRSGWIFANGFDKNTGLPYIEDINSSKTEPAGNGDDDVRPVERSGGTLWTDVGDGTTTSGPALPCGFGSGFNEKDGTRWIFCADTPRITAYRLEKGAEKWRQVGVPSKAVIPATADELPVVLPPV
jgi:hypothetical protein